VDTTRDDGWLAVTEPAADPAWLVVDEERRREVVRAIAGLPSHQRRMVAMRFYSDLSLEEIAAATGTPVGTVKSRLHRAMASLREHLGSNR
jgi:RNA polymerase sigma-70 factor, ECF subfamily